MTTTTPPTILFALLLFAGICNSCGHERDADVEKAIEVLDDQADIKAHSVAVEEDLQALDEEKREVVQEKMKVEGEKRLERIEGSPFASYAEHPEELAPHLNEKIADVGSSCDLAELESYFKMCAEDQVFKEIRSNPKYTEELDKAFYSFKALKKKCKNK